MAKRDTGDPEIRRHDSGSLAKALEFVTARLDAIVAIRHAWEEGDPWPDEWVRWWRVTASGLQQHFGHDAVEVKWCTPDFRTEYVMPYADPDVLQTNRRKRFHDALDLVENGLRSILEKYETLGLPTQTIAERATATKVRAFVSHGGIKPSLAEIQEFLRALGIEPVVVERAASEGREVHGNVDYHRLACDFAIVVWTRDIETADGSWVPSGSVSMEAGELRVHFGSRIIYLSEQGTSLHTLGRTIAYEPFTDRNMAGAFRRIATELTAWGWLTVVAGDGPSSAIEGSEVSVGQQDSVADEERGFLDWAAGIEESTELALASLLELNGSLVTMGEKMGERAEAMPRAQNARERLRIGTLAASDIAAFRDTAREQVPIQRRNWEILRADAVALFSSEFSRQAEPAEVAEAKGKIAGIAPAAEGAIASMRGLQESTRDLRKKNASAALNRACDEAVGAITTVIHLFEYVAETAQLISTTEPPADG